MKFLMAIGISVAVHSYAAESQPVNACQAGVLVQEVLDGLSTFKLRSNPDFYLATENPCDPKFSCSYHVVATGDDSHGSPAGDLSIFDICNSVAEDFSETLSRDNSFPFFGPFSVFSRLREEKIKIGNNGSYVLSVVGTYDHVGSLSGWETVDGVIADTNIPFSMNSLQTSVIVRSVSIVCCE